jgi:RimJ/RimL family protein N-acetyltransferase
MNITLEVVSHTPENANRAQCILEAAPRYERMVSAKEVSSDAGEEFLIALPPGKVSDDKATFIVRCNNEDVGVIDCIRAWREVGFAHIGLLLIAESHQGRGIGAMAVRELETWIAATWPETHTLRIGVIENNLAAFAFWNKLGFMDTGERRDNGFVAPAAVMLKRLHA